MYTNHTTLPEMLLASPRTHNRLVREGMETELIKHRDERLPEHFEQKAHAKYGYMPRQKGYIGYKIRRYPKSNGLDLVKSGNTRERVVKDATITLSGAAASETLRGTLKSRLPFDGGTGERFDDAAYERYARLLASGFDSQGRLLNAEARRTLQTKLAARKSERGKVGVTAEQMVKEIEAMTAGEKADVVAGMKAHYVGSIRVMKKPRRIPGTTLPAI